MSITDEQAQIVINAAIAKSEELGYAITVAVVDSAGEVTAVRRMDGVGPINFDFAYGCAYTAATTSRTGVELDWVKDTNWWRAASVMRGGRLMVARGALPLRDGDKVVGGIGVSGAPGEIDLAVAEAGAAALEGPA